MWLPITERKEINKQTISRTISRKEFCTHEKLVRFLRRNEGLTIVEYAVAAGLIVASVALTFSVLGPTIDAIITTVIGFL